MNSDVRTTLAGAGLADEARDEAAEKRPAQPAVDAVSAATPGRLRSLLRLATLRTHWLMTVFVVVGIIMRIITLQAYQPGLLNLDSWAYLDNAGPLNPQFLDPIGYPLLILRPLLPLGGIHTVVIVQHLAGLGIGLAIYVLALRLGSRRWLAALAAAPVLIDAFELNVEETILSDIWLQVAVVIVVWLLLAKGVPGPGRAALAGLFVGVSLTIRMVALPLIVPVVLYLILAGGQWRSAAGWRKIATRTGACAAAFAVVVFSYAAYFHSVTGQWGLNTASGNSIYGRTAEIANCPQDDLTKVLQELCPKEPLGQRLGSDAYAHADGTPGWPGYVPPGKTIYDLDKEFAYKVIEHQPLQVAAAVLVDFAKGFWPTHITFGTDPPAITWQFLTVYPAYYSAPNQTVPQIVAMQQAYVRKYSGGPGVASPVLGQILRDYQTVIYTPGPFLLLAGIFGCVAGFGYGRAKRSKLRAPALLLVAMAVTLLAMAAAFEFSWRYQLPALVLLPLAAAVALTALTGGGARREPVGELAAEEAALNETSAEEAVADDENGPAEPT
ncbi:MAG TPA: hypothetical protein VHX38_37740 [Pseudonocardiaceae bacterium]|jgi:hypothetical protein|nr:hypothetical protein [Pseudonocardiaceae bacterium]